MISSKEYGVAFSNILIASNIFLFKLNSSKYFWSGIPKILVKIFYISLFIIKINKQIIFVTLHLFQEIKQKG